MIFIANMWSCSPWQHLLFTLYDWRFLALQNLDRFDLNDSVFAFFKASDSHDDDGGSGGDDDDDEG